ncbi:FG-GAP-like repeat-containing protein [Thermogladius sp. 4427co]|uniref:FG-GAP-like repeat-containing protein n=1 Tax=Thermogladius sp. 4427co TaxID=3450718 RepID=UPI003F78F8A4
MGTLNLALILLVFSTVALLAGSNFQEAWKPQWLMEKGGPSRIGFYNASYNWSGRVYTGFQGMAVFTAGLCIATSPIIADLNGNGVNDIVFNACDGYTYAISGVNYTILWKYPTRNGLSVPAAGYLRGDGVLYVVVPGPRELYCLRGDNGSLVWVVEGYFGRASPAIADVDGDGLPEVVANTLDGHVVIISGDGSVKADITVGDQPVSTPAIGDVDGDGIPDIVVAEGSTIHIVSFENGNWTVRSVDLDSQVKGYPSLYDIDRDGVVDVLVATENYLYALSIRRGVLLWKAPIEGDSFSSPSVGDVFNTGSPSIVIATTKGIYVFSLNGILQDYIDGVNAAYGSVIITDIDGDSHNEMIVARYDGILDVVDLSISRDYYEAIKYEFKTGGPIMKPPSIGDVTGDGLPDIVFGSRDYNLYVVTGIAGVLSTSWVTTPTTSQATSGPVTQTTTVSLTIRSGGYSSPIQPNYILLVSLTLFLLSVSALIVFYARRRR